MKIVFTLLILLMYCVHQNAQRLRPFMPIEFSELNPDWLVAIKDTVLAENTDIKFLDEYNGISTNFFSSGIIKYDDFFYQSYYVSGGLEFGGCLLECRSLSNGKLIWQRRYGIFGDNIQSIIRLMKIDSLGRLVVMGQRKKHSIDSPLNDNSLKNTYLFQNIINPYSGEVIENSKCEYESIFTHSVPFNTVYGHYDVGAVFFEGDNYRYYEYINLNGDKGIRSVLLDKCGLLISDSVQTRIYDIVDKSNILEIGNDTIMIMTKKYLAADSTFAFNFKYYTRDLVLLDSVLTESFPNYMVYQQILGLSKDRKKILLKWSRWDNDNPLPPTPESVGVFDLKGKLCKVAHLEAVRFSNPVVLDWEKDNDELIILQADFKQQNAKTSKTSLVASKFYDGGQTKEILAHYEVADSLQIGIAGYVKDVSENKWLIIIGQIEFYIKSNENISQDPNGFATILMLVDKDRFTKPTSSQEVAADDKGLTIYPNPGSDALTLAWQYPFSGEISVHNAQGHFVRQYPVDQHQEYIMDASAWPPGLYLLRIYNSQKQVTNIKKWVKY